MTQKNWKRYFCVEIILSHICPVIFWIHLVLGINILQQWVPPFNHCALCQRIFCFPCLSAFIVLIHLTHIFPDLMAWNFLSSWFTSARPRIKIYLSFIAPKDFWLFLRPISVYFLVSVYRFWVGENKSIASIWEASTSEIYWLITTFLCEGYWVLIFVSNQRLHLYSPLAKAKQGCGFATPSVSGWCPQCLRGTLQLGSGALVNLHLPDSQTSSLTTNWSQSAGSAEERQFGGKGWLDCQLKPQLRIMCFPLVLLELLPLVFAVWLLKTRQSLILSS